MERSMEDSREMRDGRAEKLSVHIADASTDVPGVQSEVEQAEADMRLKMAAREQALREQWVERERTLRLEMAEQERTLELDAAARKQAIRDEMERFEQAIALAEFARLNGEQLNRLLDELDELKLESVQLRAQRDAYRSEVNALSGSKVWRAATAYVRAQREGPRGLTKLGVRAAQAPVRALYRAVVPSRIRQEAWYRRHGHRALPAAQSAVAAPAESTGSSVGGATPAASPEPPSMAGTGGVSTALGPDILCFPIIDWDFRFQRPQQLLSQFARAGHRTYYLNTAFMGLAQPEVKTRHIGERIEELFLPGDAQIAIHRDPMPVETLNVGLGALRRYCEQHDITNAICLVQHPFWVPLVNALNARFGWKIVYDCLDDHSGFGNYHPAVLQQETELISHSDLVITTSRVLQAKVEGLNPNCLLVPNAADYVHFSTLPAAEVLPQVAHPVIGYYGAIAEWFDVEAIALAAEHHPDWSFVLIGHTFGADLRSLERHPNVYLVGEQPYAALPRYVAAFDVCAIPFLRTPLTEATNPVKLFEYLATGKPIVARRLPELEPYESLLAVYDHPSDFGDAVERALASSDDAEAAQRRRAVAQQNTWEARYEVLAGAVRLLYGKVTIIVVTYNNLEYTRRTLSSVLEKTRYPNFAIVVVDNGSTADLTEYLTELAAAHANVKVVLNGANLGFAAANNIGIRAAADSEYIVLLNNDVIVTPGWLGQLIRHLADPRIGMVGPVTNNTSNEARLELSEADLADIDQFARRYTSVRTGLSFDIPLLAMFCTAMRRSLVDEVGLLDEQFAVGMFEDDDYTRRVRNAGYRVVCAEDVFVHHIGRASFSLLDDEHYQRIFDANRAKFEAKWQQAWTPHRARLSGGMRTLLASRERVTLQA